MNDCLQQPQQKQMSIYSGFATRQQQNTYDNLLQDLVFVLQKRILKFYNNDLSDQQKFYNILMNLHQQLSKMDQNKYLPPKFSTSIKQLLQYLHKINNESRQTNRAPTSHKKRGMNRDVSLDFSIDKAKDELNYQSGWLVGKIKHQRPQQGRLNEFNPEQFQEITEDLSEEDNKKLKFNVSRDPSKVFFKSKVVAKRHASKPQSSNGQKDTDTNQKKDKRHVQYIIKEFVTKNSRRRHHDKRSERASFFQ